MERLEPPLLIASGRQGNTARVDHGIEIGYVDRLFSPCPGASGRRGDIQDLGLPLPVPVLRGNDHAFILVDVHILKFMPRRKIRADGPVYALLFSRFDLRAGEGNRVVLHIRDRRQDHRVPRNMQNIVLVRFDRHPSRCDGIIAEGIALKDRIMDQ